MSQASPASLPDEIWSQCFTSLDYFDLRHVEMICKRFREILKIPHYSIRAVRSGSEELIRREHPEQDSPFDAKLFRKGPGPERLQTGRVLELHPLLELVNPVFSSPGDAVCGFREIEKFDPEGKRIGWDSADLNAYDYPAIEEYATSLACRRLKVDIVGVAKSMQNDGGVTVRQVVNKCIKIFDQRVFGEAAEWAREYHDLAGDAEVCVRDTLGDRNGFAGYQAPVVLSSGVVKLQASSFDS